MIVNSKSRSYGAPHQLMMAVRRKLVALIQSQEGFVAAKLLVDRPTTASDLGGISQMVHGYRKMKREFRGDLMTS